MWTAPKKASCDAVQVGEGSSQLSVFGGKLWTSYFGRSRPATGNWTSSTPRAKAMQCVELRNKPGAAPLLLLLLLAALAGCSGREIETYPVRGKVVFKDGRALTNGYIYTRPEPQGPDNRVYAAKSAIAKDGTFVLSTFADGDGAIAGKHAVIIDVPTAREMWDEDDEVDPATRAAHQEIAQKFRVFGSSGLEIDVAPNDKNQEVEFVVSQR